MDFSHDGPDMCPSCGEDLHDHVCHLCGYEGAGTRALEWDDCFDYLDETGTVSHESYRGES